MDFIDRTGHIFSLESYSSLPIGYEYQETPYIFRFKSDSGYKLSVDNYYFKPIRIVNKIIENVNSPEELHFNIKIEQSNKFYLIDSDIIESKLMNDINNSIILFEKDITSSQELDYTEKISWKTNNETESIEIDVENSDFKGTIVEENIKEYGTLIKYIDPFTHEEYTGELHNITELNYGESYYINSEGDTEIYTENSDTDIILGVKEFANNTSYVKLDKVEVSVIINDDNRDLFSKTETKKELYLINTFYVVVNSSEDGLWTNNILININDEWCPITIAAEFIDENEELVINGKNFGISLPKEIVQAIYSSNYDIINPDENKYYEKLKEYLMNYMSLRGELGNYKSVINGLKWFEWGDKLTISKLLKNDNEIQNQYIKDFFDILNDNIYSYQLFKDTSLLNIELKLTEEDGRENQNYSAAFWGEGKPILINKFNKLDEVSYDEKEYIYYKGYFNFTFNDLGLKLAALKYYYEKYFLPIHIKIHKAYMSKQIFSNDIKLINKVSHGITAKPIYISNSFNNINENSEYYNSNEIIFNNNFDTIYFNRHYKKNIELDYSIDNKLYVDSNFNEFSNYLKEYVENSNDIFYEVNETCIKIPIQFLENKYYNVNLILSRYIDKNNDDVYGNLYKLYESSFKFIQTNERKYQSFIIYPKLINEMNDNKFEVMYWLNNKFRLDLIVNGTIHTYIFNVKMPEFNIEMGTLKYKYDDNFRQLSSIEDNKIKFNAYMYLPNLVSVNNIEFNEQILELSNNLINYINLNYKESIKFLNKKYLNVCHLLNLTDRYGNIIPYTINGNEIDSINIDNYRLSIDENNNIELYSAFFNEDGSYNFDKNLIRINKNDYDLFIMHDYKQWYGILISKEPIDYITKKDKNFKFGNGAKEIIINNYRLSYIRSDKKFLINRYMYNPSNGINHFNDDDIIVASLKNNDKLCFKLSNGSKWIITPLSLGNENVNTIISNTELMIVSIPEKYSKYAPGYYSISIQYSVDDDLTNTYTKKSKFKIDSK